MLTYIVVCGRENVVFGRRSVVHGVTLVGVWIILEEAFPSMPIGKQAAMRRRNSVQSWVGLGFHPADISRSAISGCR